MKILSLVFILVAISWALLLYWIDVTMTGITERMPLSEWSIATLIGTALELMVPILLICGPTLILSGWHRRLGSVLTLLGCLILTVVIANIVKDVFRMSWSDAKAYLPLFAIFASITLLCDIGAIRLYQLVSTSLSKVVS